MVDLQFRFPLWPMIDSTTNSCSFCWATVNGGVDRSQVADIICGALAADQVFDRIIIRFLSSLDGLRHRDMSVNIENQRKLGTAKPAILAIAYAIASIWKSTTLAPGSVAIDFNAVYLCTDDVLSARKAAASNRAASNHGKVS
jgi:hypothetical protein